MKAYRYDREGIFFGILEVEEDKRNPGSYILPPNTTLVEPPTVPSGKQVKFEGGVWTVVDPSSQSLSKEVILSRLSDIDVSCGIRCVREAIISGAIPAHEKQKALVQEVETLAESLRQQLGN